MTKKQEFIASLGNRLGVLQGTIRKINKNGISNELLNKLIESCQQSVSIYRDLRDEER